MRLIDEEPTLPYLGLDRLRHELGLTGNSSPCLRIVSTARARPIVRQQSHPHCSTIAIIPRIDFSCMIVTTHTAFFDLYLPATFCPNTGIRTVGARHSNYPCTIILHLRLLEILWHMCGIPLSSLWSSSSFFVPHEGMRFPCVGPPALVPLRCPDRKVGGNTPSWAKAPGTATIRCYAASRNVGDESSTRG